LSVATCRDRALASASPAAITASVWREPLAGVATHVTVPEGVSLAELVTTAFPDAEMRRFVVVLVDGEEVPETGLSRVVRAGETVSLVFRAGKDFFRAVLQLAVIAVAAWIGGPAGVSVLGTWGAAVAAAGVAIVGNLIINSLVPLKMPGQLAAPDPFYSVTGARNSASLYEPFPILLGRHRILPRLWGKPVQETFGDKVYLRYALALGMCPMAVSDWKIGETALEEYDGVDLELRLTEDAPPHTLYTGDPEQTPGGAQLNHTDWATLTTATDVDEIELVYGFRGGLGAIDSKNRKVSRTVSFHIEYRPHGSSDAWQSYRPSTRQANLAAAAAGAPYRPDYFGVHPDLEEWVDGLDGIGAVSNTPYSVTRADPGRPFQRAVRFSVPRGQYDVRTIRTAAQSGDAAVSDGAHFEYLTSIRSAVDPFPNRKIASAVVRVLASDQLSGIIDTINCIAESLQPVFSTEALEAPEDAGADSLEAPAASSNPAHLALLVARGPQNRRPKPDDEIDWPAWADFAARCQAAGLTFNEYVTSKVGRWELLRRICTAGYARPVKHGGRLSVVMDRLRTGEAPSQAFSGRNMRGFRWRKTFPREVHALRVGFANADNGWQADEVIIYLPGWTEETASVFEQLPLPGKTDPDEVRTVANQYARNAVFQTEGFEFETDAEYLVSKRGDYVVISHHAMAVGLGAARVVAREIDGEGDVTAVVLDAPVATEAGPSLALQWRTVKVDGGSARMEVLGEEAVTRDAANPNRFVFVTPLAAASAPVAADGDDEGDIALVGVATKVSIEALVTEIEPRPHLQAAIRCVAYAPERFVEAPDWDAHNPKVTLPFGPRPDAPLELATVARSLEIAVGFDAPPLPAGLELVGFETAVRETGATEDGWSPLGMLGPDERVAVAPPGDPGADYDVRIVTVARRADGILVRSDPLIVAEIAAASTPTAPAGCAASFVERTSAGGAKQLVLNATWTANEDPEILDTVVEQLVSTGPDVWQEIGRGRAAAGRCEVHGLAVGRDYDLGFVNLSRRGAPSARTTIDTVAAPDTLVSTGALDAVPGSALADAIAAAATSSDAAAADAIAAAAAAAGSATSAAGSASAASGSASAAAGSATSASNSATSANGSASAAATSASAAAASASAASGSASAASSSASSASTSATNASNSATAAAASVVSAQSVANRLIPDRLSVSGDWGASGGNGDPSAIAAATFVSSTVVNVSGRGDIRRATGAISFATRGWLPVISGHTYRQVLTLQVTTAGGSPNRSRVVFRAYAADGTYLGALTQAELATTSTFGWTTLSQQMTGATILASYATAAFVRATAVANENGTPGVTEVASLEFDDITSEVAAAASASAAATSASSAATSQSAAASSASAASTSATNAATSAGSASTSATNASNSATTAAGHAGTASTQATNAANSASAAGASATAASGSASTASTQATNAASSASAANTSATNAAASASSASSSASTATSQASAASASASSASSSATLAANYYTDRLNSTGANRPAIGNDFAETTGGGTPSSLTALSSGTVVTAANEGSVRKFFDLRTITTRKWVPVVAGHTYRMTHRTRVTADGTDNRLIAAFISMDSAGTFLATLDFHQADAAQVVADGWQTYTRDITAATILAAQPTCAWLRPRLSLNRNNAGTDSGADTEVAILDIEDVTTLLATNASIATNASAIATETTARAAADTTLTASLGTTNANVSTNASAIATINGAAAFFELVVAASGGDLSAVRLKAGASGSFLELVSTVLRLANVSNGAVIEIMRATGGEAYFSRPISSDGGGKRVTIGPGYGVSEQEVVLWFGPDTVAPSAQSRTNGYFALGTDGKTYVGASELLPTVPPAVAATDVVEINSTSDQLLCSAVVGPTATGDRIRVGVFLSSEEEAAGNTAMAWSVYFGTTLLATGALTITSAGEIVFTDDPADDLRGTFPAAHSGPDTIYLYLRKTNGAHEDRNVSGELFVEVMRTDYSVLLP
jgi:hypothetical protein